MTNKFNKILARILGIIMGTLFLLLTYLIASYFC